MRNLFGRHTAGLGQGQAFQSERMVVFKKRSTSGVCHSSPIFDKPAFSRLYQLFWYNREKAGRRFGKTEQKSCVCFRCNCMIPKRRFWNTEQKIGCSPQNPRIPILPFDIQTVFRARMSIFESMISGSDRVCVFDAILCSPCEDFGWPNEHLGTSLLSTFKRGEY